MRFCPARAAVHFLCSRNRCASDSKAKVRASHLTCHFRQACVAKGVPAQLVAEMVRVTKVVQTVATAFAARQKMIYRALQVWMVGERQSTDPALWINGFEYFLFAGDRQGTLWLLCLIWARRQCFECLHPFSNSSGSSVAFPFNRCQVWPPRRQFFRPLDLYWCHPMKTETPL